MESYYYNVTYYKMSFIQTLLSYESKQILKEIYEELEAITIPTTYSSTSVKGHYHARKTGSTNQKYGRQTCFGLTNYRGKQRTSKSTKKYPYILPLFTRFIQSHRPDFKFSSVYVNRNVVCKKHLDSKNVGESLLVGIGDYYTGGQTTLYINGKPTIFNIKSQSLIFNGSEIPHQSEKFEGTRYSLVFY